MSLQISLSLPRTSYMAQPLLVMTMVGTTSSCAMLYSLTKRYGALLVRCSPSAPFHSSHTSMLELDNILSRLIPSGSNPSKAKISQQSPPLTQLLQHERLHGTTSERDPRERRHDFHYFSKGSYFLLVEDIWGELSPIAIMEYPGHMRSIEKDKSPSYPVLYMDPRTRSPFVKFDDKEARKLEKLEANEKLKEIEKEKYRLKVKELLGNAGHQQQIASGFGPSTTGPGNGHGYLAASGNSVAITSTTTTSFARTFGNTRLPPNLRERLGRQVITSCRFEGAGDKENTNPFESRLRKAKSTTTMRLPAREESKKPGYCEACRVKFEDFTEVRASSSLPPRCLLMLY